MKNYEIIKGKNILITGGTRGIGRAIAEALLKNGANVFILSRKEADMKIALEDLRKIRAGKIKGYLCDVSDGLRLEEVFKLIDKETNKKLDVLINNASLPARSILDKDFYNLDYILKVNIQSYLVCSKLALDRMVPKKTGHIINIGSLSTDVFDEGADIYVAGKSAVEGFNVSLRKKIDKYSIKVTLIKPGSVATTMVTENDVQKQRLIKEFKFLKPEDIAKAIVYILSQSERCEILELKLKPHHQYI